MVALAVPLTGAPKAMIIVETPGVRFDVRGLRRHAQRGHREPAAQSDCSESCLVGDPPSPMLCFESPLKTTSSPAPRECGIP